MTAQPEIEGQIVWVYTDDLQDTCIFYADVLGLELIRDEGAARIYRTSPSSSIGVCRAFDDRAVEPDGGMITFVSDDVDGWYTRLSEKGAQLRGPPRRLEEFGIYGFFAEDPNGYVIEFQKFLTDDAA
jgi:predicted enzyme related to lactoylglutathione lyase